MRNLVSNKHKRRIDYVNMQLNVVLMLLLALSTNLIFSQDRNSIGRERTGNALEYELVNEIYLGDDINEVIYTNKTAELPQIPRYMKRRSVSYGGIKSQYEYIRVDDFQPLADVKVGGRLRFSTYGNYYVKTEFFKDEKSQSIHMTATLYRYSNIKVWQKDFSRKMGLFVSDNGRTIVGMRWGRTKGKLVFYNSKGDSINSNIFSDQGWEFEKSATGRFSEDGQYFVVIANYSGPPPDYRSSISLFSSTGELQWSFKSPQTVISSNISLSPNASYIISYHFNFTGKGAAYLHDRKGNLIKKYEGLNPSFAVFSESQEFAVIGNHNKAYLIRSKTGEVVVEYASGALSVDISEELGVVVMLQDYKIRVFKINEAFPSWELNLPIIEKPEIGAKLSLSGDGKIIGVKRGSKYSEYKLKD